MHIYGNSQWLGKGWICGATVAGTVVILPRNPKSWLLIPGSGPRFRRPAVTAATVVTVVTLAASTSYIDSSSNERVRTVRKLE